MGTRFRALLARCSRSSAPVWRTISTALVGAICTLRLPSYRSSALQRNSSEDVYFFPPGHSSAPALRAVPAAPIGCDLYFSRCKNSQEGALVTCPISILQGVSKLWLLRHWWQQYVCFQGQQFGGLHIE